MLCRLNPIQHHNELKMKRKFQTNAMRWCGANDTNGITFVMVCLFLQIVPVARTYIPICPKTTLTMNKIKIFILTFPDVVTHENKFFV